MSEENVEIVRRTYETTKSGDYDTTESYIRPEIEFHTNGRSPEAGVYRGKEAVGEHKRGLFQQFESIRFELEELVDAGARSP
jgi:ketosteroid isomerase-like protein